MAHATSEPLSDGGAGEARSKLTSLASAAKLPKVEAGAELSSAEQPGALSFNKQAFPASPCRLLHPVPASHLTDIDSDA